MLVLISALLRLENEKSLMEKKATETSGDNVKTRCDQWRSPAKGAGPGTVMGRFAHCYTHFHSPVWLFRSDGLCSATESHISPQLLGEGRIQLQGLKPLGLCSHTPARALQSAAGLGRHHPKPTSTWLAGAHLVFPASIMVQKIMLLGWYLESIPSQTIVCLHSARGSGKWQHRDSHI